MIVPDAERRDLLVDAGKTICKKGYTLDAACEVLGLTRRHQAFRVLEDWYRNDWLPEQLGLAKGVE